MICQRCAPAGYCPAGRHRNPRKKDGTGQKTRLERTNHASLQGERKQRRARGVENELNGTKRKLCAQTGASITFALLLFLVCSVLSVVILVAATTASGRIAGIAQSDQRYYSVTSASALLKQMIEGETVTITTVTYGTRTDLYKYAAGTGELTSTSSTSYDESSASSTVSKLVNNKTSIPEYAADQYNKATPGRVNLTLTTNQAADALSVSIVENVDQAGKITLVVEKRVAPTDPKAFKQKLVFSASVAGPVTTVIQTPGSSQDTTVSGENYTVRTPITKTETKTIKWKLTSVETIKES